MPAAPGTVRLYDANSLIGGRYTGRWEVNIPAFTAPGDGNINELDFAVPIPGVDPTVYTTGFWIGNDTDADPTRFTGGVDIDSAALPAWVTYSDTGNAGGWSPSKVNILIWDGNWDIFDLGVAITVDPASDPDWHLPVPGTPAFTSVAPTDGHAGVALTFIGTDLDDVTALYVRYDDVGFWGGGFNALLDFTVVNSTTITATINPAAGYGPTHVYYDNPDAAKQYTGLTFEILAPAFTSIAPSSGYSGEAHAVTITGVGLSTVTELELFDPALGGSFVPLADFVLVNDTTITATVPATTTAGNFHVYHNYFGTHVDTGLTFTATDWVAPSLPITEDDAHVFTQDGPNENNNPGEVFTERTFFGNWTAPRSLVFDHVAGANRYVWITSRETNPAFIHAGDAAIKLEYNHGVQSGSVGVLIPPPWTYPNHGGYSPAPPPGTTVQVSIWVYAPATNTNPTKVTVFLNNGTDGGGPGVTIGSGSVDLVPDTFTQIVVTGDVDVSPGAYDTAVWWSVGISPQAGYEWDGSPGSGLFPGDVWYLSDADAFAMLGGWGVGMIRMGASA